MENNKDTRKKLRAFENKVLRSIYGPVRDTETHRSNRELKVVYNRHSVIEAVRKRKMQ